MLNTLKKSGLLIILVALVLTACGTSAGAPTVNPEQYYTEAAMTMVAQLTESALLNPSPTFTELPTEIPPTATQALPTVDVNAPEVTEEGNTVQPSSASNTVIMATATTALAAAQATDLDYAVTYQYPPDATVLSPNISFSTIWTIENTGTETWTKEYTLQFFAGERLDADRSVNFSKEVAPGQSISFRIYMQTPSKKGEYNSWWKLKDANGNNFGDLDITINIPG